MSLDDLLWRRLHFQNVIMKCLSIESVEYCYLIPIVSQLADYWGDIKMACLCKIMSRQVKQHLIHAIHIHSLLSTPFRDPLLSGSQKGREPAQLKEVLCALTAHQNLLLNNRLTKGAVKSRKCSILGEASSCQSSSRPYSTSSYLLPSQSGSSVQRFQMEIFIGQKDLRQNPSFLFGDEPNKERCEAIRENTYKQVLRTFPFKLWSKNPLSENFPFSQQNNQIYALSPWAEGFAEAPLTEGIQFLSDERCVAQKKNASYLSGNLRERRILAVLHNIDNSFFQLLEDRNRKGPDGQPIHMNFIDECFAPLLPFYGSSSLRTCKPSFQKTPYEVQDFIWNLESHMAADFFGQPESIRQKRVNKIVESLFKGHRQKDLYFLFLQILRNRKIWKAEQWYPFVSTISLNSRLFVSRSVGSSDDSSFSCFATSPLGDLRRNGLYGYHKKNLKKCRQISLRDLREDKLSQSFLKNSQSEKQLGQLVTILINK